MENATHPFFQQARYYSHCSLRPILENSSMDTPFSAKSVSEQSLTNSISETGCQEKRILPMRKATELSFPLSKLEEGFIPDRGVLI